ncbi:MAG: FecR domain-containing protein [Microscillaceae bacterium]|nr:FecR domain-containing protein [Microscillaceae bacterium]
MKQEDFLKLVDKYNAGKCTPVEEALILRFCEEVQKEDLSSHWNLQQEKALRDQMLYTINQKIKQAQIKSKPAIQRRLSIYGQLAASVLLIVALTWMLLIFFKNNTEPNKPYLTRNTSQGERITIALSDGSTVRLNSESTLRYPETFDGNQREVQLVGEAYFAIKHDTNHPFVVHTQQTSTRVLGTQFNIKAKDSLTKVSLVQGSVEVSLHPKANAESESVVLKPKQEFVWNKNSKQVAVREFDLYAVVGWKDNIFNFQKTDLGGVADQLQAHFGTEIRFADENLKQYRTRGVFKGASAQEVLKSIFSISPEDCMEVEAQEEGLFIKKTYCH